MELVATSLSFMNIFTWLTYQEKEFTDELYTHDDYPPLLALVLGDYHGPETHSEQAARAKKSAS